MQPFWCVLISKIITCLLILGYIFPKITQQFAVMTHCLSRVCINKEEADPKEIF